MAIQRVSIGKACANALARWLKTSLTEDVRVFDHWPASSRLKGRAVTVVRVSTREKDDSFGFYQQSGRTNLSPKSASIAFKFGDITQPLQLDAWADSEDGRDDLIAQLDDVLWAGVPQTMNTPNGPQTFTGNPFRDGLLLQLEDGFEGNTVDIVFDDVHIHDDAESIERREYRATWTGPAVASYAVTRTVPRMVQAELKAEITEKPVVMPPSPPYSTVTLTLNPTPPPAVTVTLGTSDS
jgi:hypothetical protein